jgi:hypothetical protein
MTQHRLLLLMALAVSLSGCSQAPKPSTQLAPAAPPGEFVDVSKEMGIEFVHVNGAAGKKYMPETMGSGCAFLDFNADGLLDILLINGMPWTGTANAPTMKLYQNDGARFVDVTNRCGLSVPMYGMGVAVGDFDNDGFPDLFITAVGEGRLFHNEPSPNGRRYRDFTAGSGIADRGWSTSATWIDFDRDGRLDLFVCHYVQWSPATDLFTTIDGVQKSYATPQRYPGESCRLYKNLGGGRFRDVTKKAGILNRRSKALGVVALDYDQDGWADLAVANDTEQNFLFHNETNGTFKEVALETGIAMAETGKAKAGMGIDTADETNSGSDSIVITNFAGEQLTLYRSDASNSFLDAAAVSGIGAATQLYLGFGVFFFDYDLDGWQDLLVYNGHIQEDAVARQTGVQYKEPALLLKNTGGSYRDITASAGSALQKAEVGRGAAWGDFDNDGRPDVLLTSNGGPARLLRNDTRSNNHWLRITLVGTKSNRDAIGARVRVKVGAQMLSQMVKGASSYLSQSDRRLLFGLGSAKQADEIHVQWPNGSVETFGATPADQSIVLTEK